MKLILKKTYDDQRRPTRTLMPTHITTNANTTYMAPSRRKAVLDPLIKNLVEDKITGTLHPADFERAISIPSSPPVFTLAA